MSVEAWPLLARSRTFEVVRDLAVTMLDGRKVQRWDMGGQGHDRGGARTAPAVLHGGVIVFLTVAGVNLAQRHGDHLGAGGGAKAAPHELFARILPCPAHGSGRRHGEHVEQHCEAGDPGKCKALSGHEEFHE